VIQVGRAGLVQGGQPSSSARRRQAAPSRHLTGGYSFGWVSEEVVHLSELGEASRVVVTAGFALNVAGKSVNLVEANSALAILSPKQTVLR